MSANKKNKSVPAKTDAEGWIKTRKDKYKFVPRTHATRAPLSPKKTSTDNTNNHENDMYSFAKINHTSRASLSTKKSATITLLTNESSIISPPMAERVINPYVTCPKSSTSYVIDQSKKIVNKPKDDDSGLLLEEIKKGHKLFFTYDPRGYKTKPLPKGYCEDCLCLVNYCTEIVFGHMSYNHALTKAYTPGNSHSMEERVEMRGIFDEAYTEAVFLKLRWNGFDLNAIQEKESLREIRIPKCMKKKQFEEIIKKNRTK